MAPTSVTSDLTDRLHELVEIDLPVEVSRFARNGLLSAVAAAIGAHDDPTVELVASLWVEHGAEARVPVLGRAERLDLLSAILVNGTAAYAGHAGVERETLDSGPAAMASALGLGYVLGSSGAQTLRAYALGREVQARLAAGLAADDQHAWNNAAVCAPVGCAVTAALLLGLDVDRMKAAMGIAAAQLLGHREGDDTMIEPFLVGKGAANGVHAALLAEEGLTGATSVLEHPRGFFAVLAGDQADLSSVVDGFGDRWLVLETEVAFEGDPRERAMGVVDSVLPGRAAPLASAIDDLGGADSVRPLVELTIAEVRA